MFWLLLIAIALWIVKRRGRLVSALFPILALWLTTLASPVYCEYRYLYGLALTAPVFLCLALSTKSAVTSV